MAITVRSEMRVQTETIAARLPYQTILVVEDDEEIRVMVAQQLTKAGYLVLTAWDGPTMFTALNAHTVDLIGLEVGADDYISKPFDPRELLARVRSVMRRAYVAAGPQEAPPPKRVYFR